MITYCYSIFDLKTDSYFTPFFSQNDGAAIRNFRQLANDPETMIGKFPGDFNLYRLAKMDSQNGICDIDVALVVSATSLINAKTTEIAANG